MIGDLLSHFNMMLVQTYIERYIKQNKANKMKNSQYPRIKKSSCSVVLFTSEKSGFLLENLRGEALHYTYDLYSYRTDWVEGQFEDYPEWLINKLGYLEDKEQINLIFDMARNHGMKTSVLCKRPGAIFLCFKNFDDIHMQVVGPSASKKGYQHFDLGFLSKEDRKVNKDPEMDKVNAEVEEQLIEALKGNEGFLPEFNHTVQNAEKFESSESKEWPKAGDSVLYGPLDLRFKVIAIDGYLAWIKNDFGINVIAAIKELKKPKSPEVELSEALAKKGVQDVVILANQIINGEFDCLKYIPKEER